MSATLTNVSPLFLSPQDKSMNMNALHINSMLDKKAVGAPVTNPGSGGSFAPGFFRRNSTSNLEAMNNGNKYPLGSYNSMKENTPTSNSSATALMNKENKFRDRAFSESINSTRYKTELCRPFEENGSCKYGEKCQFAHGYHELRSLSRHPKYKTEPRPAPASNANAQPGEPRCGYGQRDMLPPQQLFTQRDRPKLHHSLSFSGFSTHHGLESPLLDSPTSRTPPPQNTASSSVSSFYEEAMSPSSCINSAFNFPGQDLKALLAPLAVHTSSGYNSSGAYYGNMPSPPPSYNMSHLQALRRLNESPVFDPLPAHQTRSLTGKAMRAGPSALPAASAAPSPRVWTRGGVCQSSAGCRFPMTELVWCCFCFQTDYGWPKGEWRTQTGPYHAVVRSLAPGPPLHFSGKHQLKCL
uniref:mRNA decay activator protein ZFP36 n=1 Tax=Neogobius melanostomus TaxID=47308 RepID=A0A8C6US46_9GOBI